MPSFFSTVRRELLSLPLLLGTLGFALLYLGISVSLLNMQLLFSVAQTTQSLVDFFSVFISLFAGLWTSLSLSDFILTISTSLFVGMNIILLIRTIYLLEHRGKVRLSVGGATIISLVATGCTSCGLSLLSVLGLSASLSFLPFHGAELHVGALILLFLSSIYMLRQLHNGVYCKLPQRKA